jgi:hypothetical protein
MKTERVEHNELIAVRVPPSDRWRLVGDGENGKIYPTLTETLEAFFNSTGFKGSYRLDPLDSKLYEIQEHEYEVPVEEEKKFGFYGELEFKQGI